MRRQIQNVFVPVLLTALVACAGDADTGDAALEGDTAVIAAPPAPAPAAATADGLVDPGSATREQLTAIPGMTEALADSVLARAPYENMLQVDSILAGQLSEEQRDTVYAHLWKRIDLNNASDEEILLIPGIGDRMLHEFEEYRPYSAIEQFRREMGKYVDDEEVARMEQYVEIR